MADNMKVSLVNDAFNMAIEHRNPSSGLLWHTDRGSHHIKIYYKNITWFKVWVEKIIVDAVAQSFFKNLRLGISNLFLH